MTGHSTRSEPHFWVAQPRELRAGRLLSIAAAMSKGICLCLLAASCSSHLAFATDDPAPSALSSRPHSANQGPAALEKGVPHPLFSAPVKRANFASESASQVVRQMADWVVDSGDNHGQPFALVDKTDAKVFVFHADGQLRGGAPALLGVTRGDDAVPGIGSRPLSSIRPEERTTPSGRFVAWLDRNLQGKEILWVDYDGAISLHPVITSNAQERRAQRLATLTPLDNRISYGCINVPAEFFKRVVTAAFTGTNGIVYVLPETRSAQTVFSSYDVDLRERLLGADQHVSAPVNSQVDRSLVAR